VFDEPGTDSDGAVRWFAFWEGINGVLPVWLKRVSVTYYLKPLFPVELSILGSLGLFTVVAEPTPRERRRVGAEALAERHR
jgi:hypothetical protein